MAGQHWGERGNPDERVSDHMIALNIFLSKPKPILIET
jgi:hypothetical protein